MERRFHLLVWVLLVLLAFEAQAALRPYSPFQLSWDDRPQVVPRGRSFNLKLLIQMPKGYYLYADETDVDFVSLEGLLVREVRFPRPTIHSDPFLKRPVEVYRGRVEIFIEGEVPEGLDKGEHDLVARVTIKGCSPKLCLKPEVREVPFSIEVTELTTAETWPHRHQRANMGAASQAQPVLGGLLKSQDFSLILDRGVMLTVLVVFIAGLLTSLTPCIWPVIPVVLIFVGIHPHKRFRENLLLAALVISGMILVYAVLGIGAVAIGKNLGFLFQRRWFIALVVLFFLAMSLAMFGVFDLRLPRRWHRRLHQLGGEGYRGAFLAGLGTGLVASPCSGPVIAALLGYVALQRSYVAGFGLLLVYGLGMGLLIMLIGAAYGQLAQRLKGGPWILWVKRALGIILLFPAAFYMGSLFGWPPPSSVHPRGELRIEWLDSERDALRFAARESRPVMIEFTARWCSPCRALERRFFSRDDIVQLSFRLVPLRVDATVETKEVARLIDRYRVAGWPTIVFLDPQGRAYKDLRVSDYDPQLVERSMREAIRRAESVTRTRD